MNYIEQMKKLNISFRYFNEDTAAEIIRTEFSFFRLMEYGSLFDKYRATDKLGIFVSLDFAQLYALAELDELFRNIAMTQCLEIEQTLKTILINNICTYNDSQSIIDAFVTTNQEYMLRFYCSDTSDALNNKNDFQNLCALSLPQFLDVIHFGTLVHFIAYIEKNYPQISLGTKHLFLSSHLPSVRQIRNMSAHNVALISQLPNKCDNHTHDVSIFLSQNGIKNKTLHTNMTKAIVNDYCSLLHVCQTILSPRKRAVCFDNLHDFLSMTCPKKCDLFENNFLLKSTHTFLINVINIYRKQLREFSSI